MYVENKVRFTCFDCFKELSVTSYQQEDLITYVYDDNYNITSVYIDTIKCQDISRSVQNKLSGILKSDLFLDKIENVYITFGQLISKSILLNLGPRIKVTISPMPSYFTDIITKSTPFGLNNTLLEISIYCNISVEAFIPLRKSNVSVDYTIPLIILNLQGEVPTYYYTGGIIK